MDFFVNCNTATLAPYGVPLTAAKINHFYRRIGFSCTIKTINDGLPLSADALVDSIINNALTAPFISTPVWSQWNETDYSADDDIKNQERRAQIDEWKLSYTKKLLESNLRDRLNFFWSNHFVTQLGVYNCPSYLYDYTEILHTHALGNFKELTKNIGLSKAMLYYLDGIYNSKNSPNENYARELYELFTLGEGNGYTEEDIQNTARALTGYTNRGDISCDVLADVFDPTDFDTGSKTIFGQTGNWDYNQVIDILFTERADKIATFICTRLYEFFVHPDSAPTSAQDIITALATDFAVDWELEPILRRLFKSEHFFDDTAVGVIIKSPFDLNLNILNELDVAPTDELLEKIYSNYNELLGQELFHPVEVEGWQRDRTWINTNFMIARWIFSEQILIDLYGMNDDDNKFWTFGSEAAKQAGVDEESSNPDEFSKAIIDRLLPKGLLTPEDYQSAYAVFRRDDLDQYYNTTGPNAWKFYNYSSEKQVFELVKYIARQPEFQLK